MRLSIVAAVYALWILGIWVAFYLGHGVDENSLQIAVMCGVIPAVCQLLMLGIDWRGLVAPMKIWLALLLVMLLSYVMAAIDPRTAPSASEGLTIPAAWTPIVYILNTVLILGVGTLVAGCPDRTLLRSIAGFYCIFATPYLIYVDLTGEMVWGRLFANDLQPNNWGLMGLTVCLASFARKPGPLGIAAFLTGLATILQASSREHLLALAIALLVLAMLQLQGMSRSRAVVVLGSLSLFLLLVMFFYDPYITGAIHYFQHDVLLVDSPDRGVDSGFTGRTTIWSETLELWLKWPILGVGFRQHEQFLAGWPAHNAYLAMLADTGLLGLIVYLVLLFGSLIGSWGIKEARTRRFVVTAIVGYIVMGFFDRRTINAGNPYGIFFVLCCAVSLTDWSLRRAAALHSHVIHAIASSRAS